MDAGQSRGAGVSHYYNHDQDNARFVKAVRSLLRSHDPRLISVIKDCSTRPIGRESRRSRIVITQTMRWLSTGSSKRFAISESSFARPNSELTANRDCAD